MEETTRQNSHQISKEVKENGDLKVIGPEHSKFHLLTRNFISQRWKIIIVGLLLAIFLVNIYITYNHEQRKLAKFYQLFNKQTGQNEISANDPQSKNFNLWDMDAASKKIFLQKYRHFMKQNHIQKQLEEGTTSILLDKDAQTADIFNEFEKTSEIHDWHSYNMNDVQREAYSKEYRRALLRKRAKNAHLLNRMKELKDDRHFYDKKKGIYNKQVYQTAQLRSLVGEDTKKDPYFKNIVSREIQTLQQKYSNSQYKSELHACIISPTFNNEARNRSIWHLQSILQQQYANYRLVIINDASSDRTLESITQHLKWRNVGKDKVIIVNNKKQQTAMENIYYAVHKFCDFNQMFIIVDGDDELVGTQVLKTANAVYQKNRLYTVYFNHMEFDIVANTIQVGYSHDYREYIIDQNLFRESDHAYHHLRTMLSDLFLLARLESFIDSKGKFYWAIGDNAQFYAAMEMSCGRVKYIPEILYWYSMNTGINKYTTPDKQGYRNLEKYISGLKKYQCIDEEFRRFAQEMAEYDKIKK